MAQTKVSLEQSQVDFLNLFQHYGFKDKSSVVRVALDRLQQQLELEQLRQSADLYASLYSEDVELQQLTNAATDGWPE
jgi:Arc/MetJ-type ribon-helix-helix transcriptional regulator